MIVNEEEYVSGVVRSIVITIIVAALLIIFFGQALRPEYLPQWAIAVIDIVCGSLVGVSFGLLISEETRAYGFIILLLFILLPIVSSIVGFVTGAEVGIDVILKFYGGGIIVGILAAFFFLMKGKMQNVLNLLKKLFVALTIIAVAILGIFGIAYPVFSAGFNASFFTTWACLVNVLGIVSCIGLCILVSKKMINVRGSDVFILGPAGSGKTILGVGLWDTFQEKKSKSLIFGKKRVFSEIYNGGLSLTGQPKSIGLASLHNDLIHQHKFSAIPSTKTGDLMMYKTQKKIFGIFPVTWTVVDYAGEFYDDLSYENYQDCLVKVMESLNTEPIAKAKKSKHKGTWSEKDIENAACSGHLIDVIENSRKYEFINNVGRLRQALTIVIVYANYLNAGKAIFLVDGESIIQNFRESSGYRDMITLEDEKDWIDYILRKYNSEIIENNFKYKNVFAKCEIDKIRDILNKKDREKTSAPSSDFSSSFWDSLDNKNSENAADSPSKSSSSFWDSLENDSWDMDMESGVPVSIRNSATSSESDASTDDPNSKILRTILANYKTGEKITDLKNVWETYHGMIEEMKEYKLHKKIAICVTKVDKVCLEHPVVQAEIKKIYYGQDGFSTNGVNTLIPLAKLSYSNDKEADEIAERIDRTLYKALEKAESIHFTSIFDDYYLCYSIPMYFMSVCLDSQSKDGVHVAMGESNRIYPWDFSELFRFGTTGKAMIFPKVTRKVSKDDDE